MVQPNYKTRLNRQQRHETSVFDPYGMNRQGKALTQQRGTKLKQDLAIAGTVKPFAGYVAPPLQASSGTVGFD